MKIKGENDIIISYTKELMNKYPKHKWADKTTLDFGKTIGTIKLANKQLETDSKKLEKILGEYEKLREESEKNKPTTESLKKTVFKNMLDSVEKYGGIERNPSLLDKLDKTLKEIGVSEIVAAKNLSPSFSVKKKVTIAIDCNPNDENSTSYPEGFYSRLKNILFDKYETDAKKKEEFYGITDIKFLVLLEGEDVKEIKICDTLVGKYYHERNLIHLYYNPFLFKKTRILDTELLPIFNELIMVLNALKIKQEDVSLIEQKQFITAFLLTARKKKDESKRSIKEIETNISNYEKQIQSWIKQHTENQEEIKFIEQSIKSNGATLFTEINKVKKLPFVDKIDLKIGSIDIYMKPATLKMPNFTRSDHGKEFGAITTYLGKLKFDISPSVIKCNNLNAPMKYHSSNNHPHSSGDSGMCMGGGEGQRKVYQMLASHKFSDVVKLLWFWTKTYKNAGAYVKYWDWYDDRLSQGYPMWDAKGNRIELGDKERIKSGEQIEVTKHDDYSKNVELFKSTKLF